MRNYGFPYKGSKNMLAERIVAGLPKAPILVDLFCGGCAVAHAALLTQKFGRVHVNDINPLCPELFYGAATGKYRDEKRWISRGEFFRLRGVDPYVTFCWSFGNNGRSYLYSKEIEPWKCALHYARVHGNNALLGAFGINSDGSRADIKAHHEEYKRKYIRWWLSQQKYSAEELDALIAKCKDDIVVQEEQLRQYLLRGLASSGLTQAEVGKRLGTQMQGHYFGRSQWQFPTEEHYNKMRTFMPALDKGYNEVIGLHRLWQSLERLQSLESLQRLESLERLQSLERLESLQRLESLERLQSLERLESLQRLESLERLQSLESLTTSFKSYEAVEIPNGSVVYCDIPYKGTDCYNGADFDHERFYQWAERQSVPVFISSYDMPRDRFDCVAEFAHRSRLSATANNAVKERIFVPKGQKERGCFARQLSLFEQPQQQASAEQSE